MSSTEDDVAAGLICAYQLDGSGGGESLNWQGIAAGNDQQELRWIHLDFTAPTARTWVRKSSGISSEIAAAMLDDDSRPRVVHHGKGVMVILRGVNLNAGAKPDDMVSIRVWLEGNRIITTRRRKLQSIAAIRESLTKGKGPKNPADFLLHLIDRMGEKIEDLVDNLDETIEAAELKFSSDGVSSYRGELSSLRRQAAHIRRFLAPQRDGLERLSREDVPLFTEKVRFRFREEADRFTRYLETLDLVRERAMVAQEEVIAQLAQEQNSRMYILAIVAAIFLPLSFVTGLLGMNVGGLPGLENDAAFTITIILMLVVGVLIIGLFRYKKWM